LGEFVRDEWLPAMRPRLADKTWREWASALDRYVYSRIRDIALQELTAAHLSRLYAELIEGGASNGGPLAPSTVRGVHTRLSQALGDAVRWRLLERNPAELADPPPARQAAAARRRAMRTWSGHELATFIQATTVHRFASVWTLGAATGLRRSELLGLRWPAVNLEAATLTVLTTLVETAEGYALFDDQKTPGSGRTIHLNQRTVELLRIHRRTQLEARLRAGPTWLDHDLVLCDEFGQPLSPAAVTQAFRRAVIEWGLPPSPPTTPARHSSLPRPASKPRCVTSASWVPS
ncbi:MAG: tyrosine-type recombinase/integrase, partial [Actinomycetota bacterium]|nr:tyrosine-type recombinase/integrase [Actinomycetota bacterium]